MPWDCRQLGFLLWLTRLTSKFNDLWMKMWWEKGKRSFGLVRSRGPNGWYRTRHHLETNPQSADPAGGSSGSTECCLAQGHGTASWLLSPQGLCKCVPSFKALPAPVPQPAPPHHSGANLNQYFPCPWLSHPLSLFPFRIPLSPVSSFFSIWNTRLSAGCSQVQAGRDLAVLFIAVSQCRAQSWGPGIVVSEF